MGKILTGPPAVAAETPVVDGDVVMAGRGEESGSVAVGAPLPESPTGLGVPFRQEEEDLQVVDASPSVEEVAEEIWKVVQPRVKAVERGEVGKVVRRVV